MLLDGQKITSTPTAYRFELNEPYWSAWSKYEWGKKDAGFGINRTLIRKSHREGKDIEVLYKEEVYTILTSTLVEWYDKQKIKPIHKAGTTILIIIPQSLFKTDDSRGIAD